MVGLNAITGNEMMRPEFHEAPIGSVTVRIGSHCITTVTRIDHWDDRFQEIYFAGQH